ncbi:hypothetical protein DFS34DRAFT_597246 [Phlyctochytrium arcticum]|nr:hypothetical protein DFS34DRAFT_597246 [Phlyctochytrium arcticum]
MTETFLDGATYTVEQTATSLTVTCRVPKEFDPKKRKGDSVVIDREKLLVTVEGETEPLLSGWLYSPISKEDSIYDLQNASKSGLRVLNLHLTKEVVDEMFGEPQMYPILFSSGRNTPAPMPKDATLDDVDPHSLFCFADWFLVKLSSPERAIKWYRAAAQRGSVAACLKLGAWYELGKEGHPEIPVDRDASLAFDYHLKAADAGHPEACLVVSQGFAPMNQEMLIKLRNQENGTQLTTDPVRPKDFAKSVQYLNKLRATLELHKAVDSHRELLGLSMWRAGVLYAEGGYGLPESAQGIDKSYQYFRVAAVDCKHPRALWSLALYTSNGFGCDQNMSDGIQMLKQAMQLDDNLDLPPQLAGLEGIGLDVLVGVEEQVRKIKGVAPGKVLDVAGLVEVARGVLLQVGGTAHLEEAIDQALKELAVNVVKVETIGENDGDSVSFLNQNGDTRASQGQPREDGAPVNRGSKKPSSNKRRNQRWDRKPAQRQHRKSQRDATFTTLEVLGASTALVAIGIGLWVYFKRSRQ